ncbi:Uncharacterised protein [Mycobacteroides abscessus subsp. abscessus]|nr:Uncharacterised protein [Mycobacteroides abscessus subsp. abscessus]
MRDVVDGHGVVGPRVTRRHVRVPHAEEHAGPPPREMPGGCDSSSEVVGMIATRRRREQEPGPWSLPCEKCCRNGGFQRRATIRPGGPANVVGTIDPIDADDGERQRQRIPARGERTIRQQRAHLLTGQSDRDVRCTHLPSPLSCLVPSVARLLSCPVRHGRMPRSRVRGRHR